MHPWQGAACALLSSREPVPPAHLGRVSAVGAGQVARSLSLKPSLIVRSLIACHEPDSDFVLRLFFPGICCLSADVR